MMTAIAIANAARK